MTWREETRHELTEVGTEVDVDGVLPAETRRRRCGAARGAGAGSHRPAGARRGGPAGGRRRQDRQEAGQQGRRPAARPAGALPAGRRRRAWRPRTAQPGGGRLVYVGKAAAGGATEREQDALTPGRPRRVAQSGRSGRRRDGRARSSSRASTPAARTARCARPAPPTTPARRRHDVARATAPPNWLPPSGLHPPTDEQAAVIAAPPGPLVVIAGAGAGKTETMAARVVWLVANGYADPGQVLGLTFTRKAAGQLLRRVRSRLARLAGSRFGARRRLRRRARRPVTVGTYHAFAGHAAARTRSAAARRAGHPAAQRNRVVAVGF